MVTATTFTLFKANIQRWRPLAATTKEVPRPYGRGTSFVVSFVLALNRVNVVEMTFGVDGPKIRLTRVDHVPCHYDFMFPRRSYHARLHARGVPGALPPLRGVSPPGKQGGLGGGTPPQW